MEKKIIVTKRFRNNTLQVYEYLLKEHSPTVALQFLKRLEQRIFFIAKHPTTGKPSNQVKDIRSMILSPYNQIFYRENKDAIEILCLFDMRKNPKKKPY